MMNAEDLKETQRHEKFAIFASVLIDKKKVLCPEGNSPCWRNVTYQDEKCRYCCDRFLEFAKKVKRYEQKNK